MRSNREKPRTLEFWRSRLPHWEVADGSYFVTIHLAGAIPKAAARRIHEIRQKRSNFPMNCCSVLQSTIFHEMERWLDRASQADYLVDPQIAKLTMEAIEHRTAIGVWSAIEYVVMPNHIHLVVEMGSGRLKQSFESFKERTGRLSLKALNLKGDHFWQREWFDHWIRTPEEEAAIIEYIRQNPVKAGLVSNYLEWPYGSWHRRVPFAK